MKFLPSLGKTTLQSINASGAGRSQMILQKCRMWPYTVGTNVHVLFTTSAGNDTDNEIHLPFGKQNEEVEGTPPSLEKLRKNLNC